MRAHAHWPIQVRKVRSRIMPCDSCGYRLSEYRATFDPPGDARVTHRLCGRCIEGIKHA